MDMTATRLDELLARSQARLTMADPPVRRLLRVRAGLSQQDLASVLGVARPTVTRWESGRRTPRGDDLVRYARLLDRLTATR